MNLHPACRFLVFLSLCVCVIGCGPGNPLGRKAISGKVTFAGQPLANGSISFEPLEAGGVTSGGTIENGSYSIATAGGLPLGKYLVRINASRSAHEAPQNLPPGTPEPPAVELIPAAYNRESEETVEVTDGSNVFNFDIPSK